jgi:hypothetical protein
MAPVDATLSRIKISQVVLDRLWAAKEKMHCLFSAFKTTWVPGLDTKCHFRVGNELYDCDVGRLLRDSMAISTAALHQIPFWLELQFKAQLLSTELGQPIKKQDSDKLRQISRLATGLLTFISAETGSILESWRTTKRSQNQPSRMHSIWIATARLDRVFASAPLLGGDATSDAIVSALVRLADYSDNANWLEDKMEVYSFRGNLEQLVEAVNALVKKTSKSCGDVKMTGTDEAIVRDFLERNNATCERFIW